MPLQLQLPDQQLSLPEPIDGFALAKQLGVKALAWTVDGQQRDLSFRLSHSANVALITRDQPEGLEILRHDAAHVLAEAVKELFPETQVTIGPAIEDGFYYDFYRETSFTPDDLVAIEARMREIVKRDEKITREEWDRDQAVAFFQEMGEHYKAEIIASIPDDQPISLYRQGQFIDLCRGPHLPSTRHLGTAFKLTKLAGAYWRGDSNNVMLQRIYGTAWANEDQLAAYLHRLEEAEKRDHRKLGRELEIYSMADAVGRGLPIWLPAGVVLRDELQWLAMQEERRDGYVRVATPVLAKEQLYYQSGHLPYYQDDMYAAIEIEGERYRLRPMNCPHHHQVFLAKPQSYRDLPLRVSEYGHVFRYEASGGLNGLMRVRGMCMNDAHLYCRFDQAKAEFLKVMHLHARFYKLFGIDNFYMRFSKPDLNKLDKYVNEPEKWIAAMQLLQEAMVESGLPFVEVVGEAAFYGPKIDFMIKSVIGTEYAISTNQLDFLATERFNLRYVGEDGGEHPVYVIHRAPLGTHERFVAFLIEHYAGAFPTWLAPIQARVIPIADRHNAYAEQVRQTLFDAPVVTGTGGLRVDVDNSTERMQKKIRNAQLAKIPYILVVGDAEAAAGTVAVRLRTGQDLGSMPLDQLLARLTQEVQSRQDTAPDGEQTP
ncbi:MAG: threonine--tRNA ligase [Alphaproteobacteria bacterium]|nr:threonine--tRNA ligase [Alphaproteobacteria bacterium]